jgi:uncharacterized protein YdhG (YjbR/CyaY superfamily)
LTRWLEDWLAGRSRVEKHSNGWGHREGARATSVAAAWWPPSQVTRPIRNREAPAPEPQVDLLDGVGHGRACAGRNEMSEKKATQKFTDEERAAMKERAQELKAEAGESAVLAKIAEMPQPDRTMGERLHAIIKASAPGLSPKTWYGMPAYAKDGKVVCFFQSAQKFNSRYATLGFSDKANLDEGAMWPTSFALKELTATEEARIGALVKKAVS